MVAKLLVSVLAWVFPTVAYAVQGTTNVVVLLADVRDSLAAREPRSQSVSHSFVVVETGEKMICAWHP